MVREAMKGADNGTLGALRVAVSACFVAGSQRLAVESAKAHKPLGDGGAIRGGIRLMTGDSLPQQPSTSTPNEGKAASEREAALSAEGFIASTGSILPNRPLAHFNNGRFHVPASPPKGETCIAASG